MKMLTLHLNLVKKMELKLHTFNITKKYIAHEEFNYFRPKLNITITVLEMEFDHSYCQATNVDFKK